MKIPTMGEIKKLSNVGKHIILMNYRFNKWKEEQIKKESEKIKH